MRARTRALTIAQGAAQTRMLAAATLASAAAVWGWAMAPRLESQWRFGPICSTHGLSLGPHCPACYVAAALAALGLGLFVRSLRTA